MALGGALICYNVSRHGADYVASKHMDLIMLLQEASHNVIRSNVQHG
jgi:hypothetical protein